CFFEGDDTPFSELGVNVRVLSPGRSRYLYHAESNQENFLVLMGECLLLIEDQERRLRAWDRALSAGGRTRFRRQRGRPVWNRHDWGTRRRLAREGHLLSALRPSPALWRQCRNGDALTGRGASRISEMATRTSRRVADLALGLASYAGTSDLPRLDSNQQPSG